MLINLSLSVGEAQCLLDLINDHIESIDDQFSSDLMDEQEYHDALSEYELLRVKVKGVLPDDL
jgi:hypothetical protein